MKKSLKTKVRRPAIVIGSASETDRKYMTQDALRTLSRADEIRRDRALMRQIAKMAHEQMATLSKVAASAKKVK